jgi:hypothetical protein
MSSFVNAFLKTVVSWLCWYMTVAGRQRQENHEFKASLGYLGDPVSKTKIDR